MDWKKYFSSQILLSGSDYFKTGKVLIYNADVGNKTFSAKVKCSELYSTVVAIHNDKMVFDCTCPRAQEGFKCEHEAATCFLIEQQYGANVFNIQDNKIPNQNNTPKPTEDSTDIVTLNFLKKYESQYKISKRNVSKTDKCIDVDVRPVDIEISFFAMDSYGFLSMKIGRDKMYIVKNVEELYFSFSHNDIVVFGKNFVVDFSKARLTERAKVVFNFLYYVFKNQLVEDVQHNLLVLNTSCYPEYYKLFNEYKVFSENNTIFKFSEQKLSIPVKIAPYYCKEVFDGIDVKINFSNVIQSKNEFFSAYGNELVKLLVDDEEFVSNLFSLKHRDDDIVNLHIGRKKIDQFCKNVLPKIEKISSINEKLIKEQYKEYILPQAHLSFFLDVQGKTLSCICKYKVGTDGEEQVLTPDILSQYGIEQRVYDSGKILSDYFEDFKDYSWISFNSDKIYLFISDVLPILQEIGEVNVTDRFKKINVRKMPKVSISLDVQSNLLNLSVLTEGMDSKELSDLLASYRQKKIYHRIKDGSFINLENENLNTLSQMFEKLDIKSKDFTKQNIKIPAYRALYIDCMLKEQQQVQVERSSVFANIIDNFSNIKNYTYDVPKNLDKIIRPYQREGIKWLNLLYNYGFGGILADEMGLGKTVLILGFIAGLAKKGTSLVVCPASLVYNWKSEAEKFTPQLSCLVIGGKQEDRKRDIDKYSNYNLIITSYDLLKRDIALYEECEFNVQVIDEAQYIKNPATTVAKAVKAIKSKVRFALTGTPIENRLLELWSIFDYLMSGFLWTYQEFRRSFENPIINGNMEITAIFKKIINPFILRRLKSDVLADLPDKIEEVFYAEMEGLQKQLYSAQVMHLKEVLKKKKDNFDKSKIEILSELTKIRQICCDPSVLFESYKGPSAKREMCMELVKSAIYGGHKVLIFSQFTSVLSLIQKDLENAGIEYYKIIGATEKKSRVALADKFNTDSVPVFLVSLKAGGTGLNLLGADVVIHYDPWWNIAVQNQATDRVHRIGQTKVVTVYKLIAKDSVEEKILDIQKQKSELSENIITANNVSLGQLSKEDLLELLSF